MFLIKNNITNKSDNDIPMWNKLIKIARYYERKKYSQEYTHLSSMIHFLGTLGHYINIEEEKIVPYYSKYFQKEDWVNMWKEIQKSYHSHSPIVKDLKRCLKILKNHIKKNKKGGN